ncbi:NAD(P)-dependent alcohol dehydrogenase [Amycolatopsis pithecellobii]|uniref:Alcohol dehydrogenase catalytic domain-containing protein n=1 Tax=Amycolatopsis pithecellobii TaxID=664692 RepID=A0A6N7Z746_9PSEU|nr:NAD(P)-dependent alcohol dehydrogenase [Amycolatopsis pithecellobii]MTD55606.1 alcohol dehydrogenase catalytic domain-containing protein [Amycolatopsis pithecellobii]
MTAVPTETLAAVLRSADGQFDVEKVAIDAPAANEVLVRVVAAGMCHTDSLARAIGNFPIVPGHEGAGVVEAIGSAVTSLRPGDHVVMSFDSCGICAACHSGRPYHCAEFELLNFGNRRAAAHLADGKGVANRWFGQSSFAGYALAGERNAVKIPDHVDLRLAGPLGCGIMTGAGSVMNVMQLRSGDSIAVFGAGAVGLAAVMAAKLSGAGEIVAVDIHENRRALALELGADRVVDPAAGDELAVQVVGNGAPFDFSLDTTARAEVMSAATEVIGRPGLAVLVGAGFEPLTLAPASLAGKAVAYAYLGHANPQVFLPRLISLWQRGMFPFDRLVTSFPLADINQAEVASAAGSAIKPVLMMEGQ